MKSVLKKISIMLIALHCATTILPQYASAERGLKIYNQDNRHSFRNNWSQYKVIGGAGIAAAGAGAASGLAYSAGGWIPAGAVTLSAVGAASLGIGLGVAAAVGAGAYVGYKVYNKYKAKTMAIPSEKVYQLSKINNGMDLNTKINKYLKYKFDKVCNSWRKGYIFDEFRSKIVTRKTNLGGEIGLRGSYLTAYDDNGNTQYYDYVKGYPSYIIDRLVCSPDINSQEIQDEYMKLVAAERVDDLPPDWDERSFDQSGPRRQSWTMNPIYERGNGNRNWNRNPYFNDDSGPSRSIPARIDRSAGYAR